MKIKTKISILLFTCLLLLCFYLSYAQTEQGYQNTPDVIHEVSTRSEEEGAEVIIKLTGYSAYKVIPIEDKEIMIAIKNTEVSRNVFGSETVVGDKFVKSVEISQQPSKVASIIVKTHKDKEQIGYQIRESKNALRVQIKNKVSQKKLKKLPKKAVSSVQISDATPGSDVIKKDKSSSMG